MKNKLQNLDILILENNEECVFFNKYLLDPITAEKVCSLGEYDDELKNTFDIRILDVREVRRNEETIFKRGV